MPFKLLHFITVYGYGAVFVGAIFEGESIMLLSGFLSHGNYLSFPLIIFWAFLGAVISDLSWFLLGRYKGEKILNKWVWFKNFAGKPVTLIGRNPIKLSFLMRFMYGFRHIIPFSIGMSKIPLKVFLFWNSLGAIAWVAVFGGAGYLLANVLEAVFGNLRKYEFILATIIIIFIATIHMIVSLIKKLVKDVVIETK